MSATLAGNVYLGGYPAVNVVVRFFTPNTTTEVAKYARATNSSGDFTITGITPGTYDVGVKAGGHTSTLVEDQVFTEGNTTTINFPAGSQPGVVLGWYWGDVSGDDKVDNTDYVMALNNIAARGTCWNYPGNWLMPDWPTGGGGGGASYKLIGGQSV